MSELFKFLDLETKSSCNRYCPTCLRNSHPNREALRTWFLPYLLPIDVIKEALDQCVKLGFTGGVCLSHYNEPLMDERIPEIGELAKSYNQFSPVFMNSNGDFLTEELAKDLDGKLDKIIFSLYMKEPLKSERAEWIKSLFHITHPEIILQSDHIATHFSPKFDVKSLAQKHINHTCKEPAIRVIINHQRQYLLCCEDVIGNYDLGTFPETNIKDYWFGEKRTKIQSDLEQNGGRRKYSYCSTCPRT